MSPALCSGDFVMTTRWFYKPKVGRLVVVKHARYQTIVKRIVALRDDGYFLLSGENDSSTSTDQIGWVFKGDILGMVLLSIRQPSAGLARL